MATIDPIVLLTEVLASFGHTDINSDNVEARALSSPEYIFLRELGGSTAHIDRSNRPTMEIVVYSNTGFAGSRAKAYQIQSELREAWGQPFENGGIHRVITRIAPYRQDIPGLPYGVGRTVAQYDFILTNSEKWV